MAVLGSYIGRRIYIHDEKGKDVASTTITEHNKDYMTISVRARVSEEAFKGFVTVLILEEDGVHEYQGKLRRSSTDAMATEIALSKGRAKEDRAAARYVVNADAYVDGLVFGKTDAPMLHALDVLIVNLSSSGALIRTRPNSFMLQATLKLKLNIGTEITPMYGKIVWAKNINQTTTEYGCKFL